MKAELLVWAKKYKMAIAIRSRYTALTQENGIMMRFRGGGIISSMGFCER